MLQRKKLTTLANIFCIALMVICIALVVEFPQYSLVLSLICVILAMLPFFFSFESQRPKARDIVPVAVMAAVAVVGRWIFVALPSIQPSTAVIIMCGCAFGPTSGFMCGAVTAITSNMLLGQGMYTPWQMLAWGMCGAIAGFIYNGKYSSFFKMPLGISIYGFLTGIFYGQFMNLQFFLGYTDRSLTSFIASALSSIITDLLHGVANALILYLLNDRVYRVFKRIKTKYGLK